MDQKQKKFVVDKAMIRQKILARVRDHAIAYIKALRTKRDTLIQETIRVDREKRIRTVQEKIQNS